MDRRSFLSVSGLSLVGLALPSVGSPVVKSGKRIYVLESYRLRPESDARAVLRYLQGTVDPAAARVCAGPRMHLDAILAPHLPQVDSISEYESFDEMSQVRQLLAEDRRVQEGLTALSTGNSKSIDRIDSQIFTALDRSPAFSASAMAGHAGILELRVYGGPSASHIARVHSDLTSSGGTFERGGISPILQAACVHGPNVPNLTYLVPFRDIAERERAWTHADHRDSVVEISLFKLASPSA